MAKANADYTAQAKARWESTDYRAAVRLANKAIAHNKRDSLAWAVRAAAQMRLGRTDAAFQDANHAVALDDSCLLGHRIRAGIFLRRGDYEEAIAVASMVIARDPTTDGVHGIRAHAHRNLGNYKAAIADTLVELTHKQASPKQREILYADLAYCHVVQGDDSQFEAALDAGLAEDPSFALLHFLRAKDRMLKKQYPEALQVANLALRRKPDYGPAYLIRGQIHSSAGRPAHAIRDLSQALLTPDPACRVEALIWRGMTHHKVGSHAEALGDFRRAAKIDPTDPLPHLWQAQVRSNTRQTAAGLRAVEHALQLRPEYPDALALHGKLLHQAGSTELALAAVETALNVQPDHLRGLTLRAALGVALGNHHQAIDDATRVINQTRGWELDRTADEAHMAATCYGNRGLAYWALGMQDEAIADYTEARRLGHPESAQVLADAKRQMRQQQRQTNAAARQHTVTFTFTLEA